jgi:ATP-dependent Lon protease
MRVTASGLSSLLGAAPIRRETAIEGEVIGSATGLAWTEAGGEVLFIEATTMDGSGKLMLTGHLGEVMKESAHAALSYARARATELGIPPRFFESRDIHVHLPEGAIPKDGPSAGITMATAMLSAFTGRPVRSRIAMSGEITLLGNVLAVGGIKEKVLAAHRHGVHRVLLPEANRKQAEELPRSLRRELEFCFCSHVREVFELAIAASDEPRARDGRARATAADREAVLQPT